VKFVLFRRSRSRSRDKRSRSATPERKPAPVNAEGAITIKDEPLDKVTEHALNITDEFVSSVD